MEDSDVKINNSVVEEVVHDGALAAGVTITTTMPLFVLIIKRHRTGSHSYRPYSHDSTSLLKDEINASFGVIHTSTSGVLTVNVLSFLKNFRCNF